jgi:hypothetical protein
MRILLIVVAVSVSTPIFAQSSGGDAVIRTGDFERYVGTVSSATGTAYTTGNASLVRNTAQFNANHHRLRYCGQCSDFLAQQPVPGDQICQLMELC